MKFSFLGFILLSLLLSSCASVRRSMTAGAIGGATFEVLTGAALSQKGQKNQAITGSLIGGPLGAWAVYLVHKKLEKRDERTRKELLFNLKNFDTADRGSRHDAKNISL